MIDRVCKWTDVFFLDLLYWVESKNNPSFFCAKTEAKHMKQSQRELEQESSCLFFLMPQVFSIKSVDHRVFSQLCPTK